MNYDEKDQIRSYLIESGIATDDEIRLVTCINGYTIESLNSIIHARTGYRNIDQLSGEDGDF